MEGKVRMGLPSHLWVLLCLRDLPAVERGAVVSSFPGILENRPPQGPTTSPRPVGVGGCKEAKARWVHSQTRPSASSQPPVLQFCVALSRILQREAHTLLDSRQEPSQCPVPAPLCHVLWGAQRRAGCTTCPQAALSLAQTHCRKW